MDPFALEAHLADDHGASLAALASMTSEDQRAVHAFYHRGMADHEHEDR